MYICNCWSHITMICKYIRSFLCPSVAQRLERCRQGSLLLKYDIVQLMACCSVTWFVSTLHCARDDTCKYQQSYQNSEIEQYRNKVLSTELQRTFDVHHTPVCLPDSVSNTHLSSLAPAGAPQLIQLHEDIVLLKYFQVHNIRIAVRHRSNSFIYVSHASEHFTQDFAVRYVQRQLYQQLYQLVQSHE